MSSPRAYCEIDFPHPSQPGRLTAIFSEPECVLVAATAGEVPGLLSEAERRACAGRWVIGFVAYEAAPAFDKALRTREAPPAGLPFALFAVFRDLAAAPRPRGEHLWGVWRDETAREQFDGAVAEIRHGIAEGDYYQVNYTTRLRAPFVGDGLSFFDSLRSSQPSAYCAYMDFGPWQICCVSPELFFHWGTAHDTGRALTCRPMKGTTARRADPADDRDAAHSLQHSPKECAENLMIVDLVRNDLSRVARPGSVEVPHLFSIEAWPTVWQMTSTVTCRTNAGTGMVDVFRALFPCGSVTGAPKAAAAAAINELETSARGVYCGAIGAVLPGGEALFSVGIRTPVINAPPPNDNADARLAARAAECGIGSGITLDSDPDHEHAEWRAKQAFLMQSCPEYELLETLRLHQGRYWLLHGHLGRLARSARALGFPFDELRIAAALRAAARQYPTGQWRVRLCLSARGETSIEAWPLDQLPASPMIALACAPVASGNPWLRHKTTRRGLYAALISKQAGIFDTLLYNESGELTEFTRGNLIVELQDRLITPPTASGLLPGVFREVLLARKRVVEGVVTIEDLPRASRVWFINSVRGAVLARCATPT